MSSIGRKPDFISNPIPISSISPNETSKKIATGTDGETIGDQSNAEIANSKGEASSSDATAAKLNAIFSNEPLKTIEHTKNIEKINETRSVSRSNTPTESVSTTSNATSDEEAEATAIGTSDEDTKSTASIKTTEKREEKCETKIDSTAPGKGNDIQRKNNEEHPTPHATSTEKFKSVRPISAPPALPPVKSPLKPPPKPPMLSRKQSFGIGDQRRPAAINSPALPTTPPNTPRSPIKMPATHLVKTAPTSPATDENALVLRRACRPNSHIPDPTKQISLNHYERLIEELKCPGCASNMKAPIMLCQSGHSVCGKCTRVLLMCPLCREPFTELRSLTVEALCAKAHFRCCNAPRGCDVRSQLDLLALHEKQCVYKPMKCFMGRVWGDCQWTGREIDWKNHLQTQHDNRLFKTNEIELVWNMAVRQKPLTGYYVFDIHEELFNFYEIYDHERVLFTMTFTSTVRDRKHYFAYEVTVVHPENEALAITQKFPVLSEYEKDILAEGTCVNISLGELAKFLDDEKILHYRVRLLEIKTPKKYKNPRYIRIENNAIHPIDFQQTQIEGANLKGVPSQYIVTRKPDDIPFVDNALTPSSELEAGAVGLNDEDFQLIRRYNSIEQVSTDSGSEIDPDRDASTDKKWGSPQMHFDRKYLKNSPTECISSESSARSDRADDKMTARSNHSYAKKVTSTLRKSLRHFKIPISEMNPLHFGRRSS